MLYTIHELLPFHKFVVFNYEVLCSKNTFNISLKLFNKLWTFLNLKLNIFIFYRRRIVSAVFIDLIHKSSTLVIDDKIYRYPLDILDAYKCFKSD